MEFFNLAALYVHLIACCVAIGMLLTHDIALVRRLIRADNDRRNYLDHLLTLKDTIAVALVVLWITGLALVWIDASVRGVAASLANPKLQAKIAIVVLLTLNGSLLHARVIPSLVKAGSVLKLAFKARVIAVFAGALSAVSWFYAAMLGVGRPLAWKYSLLELLVAYPFLVLAAFLMMMLLTAIADHKRAASLNSLTANTGTG